MTEFFYRPQNAWAADFIPFYRDGTFYLYYLHDFRNKPLNGEGTPWYMISTKDFVHYDEHGEMLARGSADEQDLFVYTGCVIEDKNKGFHIFYTGHNPHLKEKGLPEQAVMHATSEDLIHWEKVSEDTFFAPDDLYEPHDWRDPFVFWNEEEDEYWMLLAARLKGSPAIRKGCTAVCGSKDLKKWELRDPLWAPEMYFTHECPDLFKIGEWWYLVFSEFTDRCITRYRMSKSLKGPWLAPEHDSFDGRAYYAAKTASDGNKRYIFGWNPTKIENDDYKGWQWGGNLVVHEVCQNDDGTLSCRIPESLDSAFTRKIEPLSDNDLIFEKSVLLTAEDNVKTFVFSNALPAKFKFEVTFNFKNNTRRFGIMINEKEETDNAFCYFIEPDRKRFSFDFWPNHPWGRFNTRECDHLIKMDPDVNHKLTVIVDHTICVGYLDGKVALNGRMYRNEGGKLGYMVNDGEVEFSDPMIYELTGE